jgi:hypothetical protein
MKMQGVEWLPHVISYVAGADLTGKEGHFVKLNSDGEVILVAAATDRAIGVLRDGNPEGGTVGVYQGYGIVPVSSDATGIAIGDLIGVSADGQAVKLTAGTDTTKYIHGVAQEASTAAGELISVAIVIPTAKAA